MTVGGHEGRIFQIERAQRRVARTYQLVFLGLREEGMLPIDFFGRSDDMGQTSLPVGADTIIGRITITDLRAGKVFTEDRLGHLGGTVSIDMKEGEGFVARKPDIVADSGVSPGGLVGMNYFGLPDLFAQVRDRIKWGRTIRSG